MRQNNTGALYAVVYLKTCTDYGAFLQSYRIADVFNIISIDQSDASNIQRTATICKMDMTVCLNHISRPIRLIYESIVNRFL